MRVPYPDITGDHYCCPAHKRYLYALTYGAILPSPLLPKHDEGCKMSDNQKMVTRASVATVMSQVLQPLTVAALMGKIDAAQPVEELSPTPVVHRRGAHSRDVLYLDGTSRVRVCVAPRDLLDLHNILLSWETRISNVYVCDITSHNDMTGAPYCVSAARLTRPTANLGALPLSRITYQYDDGSGALSRTITG